MRNILNEAFKKLEAIDQNVFDTDEEGIKKLSNFLDDDDVSDLSIVIDPDAKTEDELKDSYVGKILCRCVVCQSDIMKDESELKRDDECEDVVNCGEECPMCQSVDGYKIIGRIAPYEEKAEVGVEETSDLEEDAKSSKLYRLRQKAEKMRKSIAAGEDRYLPVELGNVEDEIRELEGASLNEAKTSPAITTVLIKNSDKLNAAGNDIEAMRKAALEILDSEELKGNPDVEKAKDILSRAQGMKFVTTLGTYMTGEKLISNKKYKRHKVDEDFAADDLSKYQKWVDFDMKKYGKISDITNSKLKDAGLEVVKDEHGDYEVTARDVDGKAIEESTTSNRYKLKKKSSSDNLNEDVDKVEVKADGQKVEVKPEGDKTVVEISTDSCDSCETIEPLSAEEKDSIENKIDSDDEVEFDEFSEEDFDELGESFLKKVYENVDSYKTEKGSISGKQLKLEGLITFKSGKKAKTNFVFENMNKTKSGKLKLIGENLQFAKNKAFTLTGHKDGKKLVVESFNYKYSAKDSEGKSRNLYGTIRK